MYYAIHPRTKFYFTKFMKVGTFQISLNTFREVKNIKKLASFVSIKLKNIRLYNIMSRDTTFSMKHPIYYLILIYCYSPVNGRKAFFLISNIVVHAWYICIKL